MGDDTGPAKILLDATNCSSITDTAGDPPSPEEFYTSFVRKRLPVIFRNQAASLLANPKTVDDLKILSLLQLSRLADRPDDVVEVNVVATNDQVPSFSPHKGSRVIPMSFKTFCESLPTNQYYMTTQNLPIDDEGRPAVCSWLSEALIRKRVLPLRPKLIGNLIPMSSGGLWIGSSSDKMVSSGLHHDMHDNLYCVITGRKHFRISPPESVHDLQMAGTLHTRHTNGRIVYKEECHWSQQGAELCPIRPDGALVSMERVMELEIRRHEIEDRLEDPSDPAAREQLEKELDDVEEELLDHERDMDTDDDVLDGTGSSGESDEEVSSKLEPLQKKAKRPSIASKPHSKSIDPATQKTKQNMPPNFVLKEHDKVKFQRFELAAGDVLYLPAGWFHEVSSKGESSKSDDSGVHIAVNYWFHPPDTTTTATSFDQPYESKFWQCDWEARQNA